MLDRSAPVTGADVWDLGPPDGSIDLVNDAFGVAFQFGHNCGSSPPTLAEEPEVTYVYDPENRLVERDDGTPVTTYVYDGQGQLVKKTEGATTTVYIGGVYEKTGSAVTSYYFFGGQRVAMRQSGTLRYLLSDHLGSTTTVLNTSGGVVSTQKYYPYGRTRPGDTVTDETDKQYTGHQREQDDLYFMQARFYDPYVGRFLAPDSIVPDPANAQALNRYSYVLGNPLRYTDPTGMCHAELGWEDGAVVDLCWLQHDGCVYTGAVVCGIASGSRSMPGGPYTADEYQCVVYGHCGGFNLPGPDLIYEVARVGCDISLVCGAGCAGMEVVSGTECFTLDTLDSGDKVLSGVGAVPWFRQLSKLRLLRFSDDAADAAVDAKKLVRRANNLPDNARLAADSKGLERVFSNLEVNHGLDRATASTRLHEIKQASGLSGAQNVVVDWTGNVFDPRTGEWIGALTRP